jgi:hypothetical protein
MSSISINCRRRSALTPSTPKIILPAVMSPCAADKNVTAKQCCVGTRATARRNALRRLHVTNAERSQMLLLLLLLLLKVQSVQCQHRWYPGCALAPAGAPRILQRPHPSSSWCLDSSTGLNKSGPEGWGGKIPRSNKMQHT